MDDATRDRLSDGNVWVRGLHMVIFLIAYNIAEAVLVLISLFQFVAVLITGQVNEPLLRFSKNLTIYVADVFEFLTFNSELRPFPFEPWPDETPGGDAYRSTSSDEADESSPDETEEVVEGTFEEVAEPEAKAEADPDDAADVEQDEKKKD